MLKNVLRGAVRILDYFIVPEADNAPAFPFEIGRSLGIIDCGIDVLTAVDFDTEPCCPACKIENIRVDDKLPSEAWPKLGKPAPEQTFRFRRFGAKLSGPCRQMF